jgi:hypothetical protein
MLAFKAKTTKLFKKRFKDQMKQKISLMNKHHHLMFLRQGSSTKQESQMSKISRGL